MSKPFLCKGFVVPTLDLRISSTNPNQMVNVEVSDYFNMKGTSFVVDSFEDDVDMIAYCSHCI